MFSGSPVTRVGFMPCLMCQQVAGGAPLFFTTGSHRSAVLREAGEQIFAREAGPHPPDTRCGSVASSAVWRAALALLLAIAVASSLRAANGVPGDIAAQYRQVLGGLADQVLEIALEERKLLPRAKRTDDNDSDSMQAILYCLRHGRLMPSLRQQDAEARRIASGLYCFSEGRLTKFGELTLKGCLGQLLRSLSELQRITGIARLTEVLEYVDGPQGWGKDFSGELHDGCLAVRLNTYRRLAEAACLKPGEAFKPLIQMRGFTNDPRVALLFAMATIFG